MQIFLLRHGESPMMGYTDDKRPLSDQGVLDVIRIGKQISNKIAVTEILHSPKRRAQETAEIIAREINFQGQLISRLELDPVADIDPILAQISVSSDNMMIVGHLPFLAKLIAQLVTQNQHREIIHLPTATLVCLEKVTADQWAFRWILPPIF